MPDEMNEPIPDDIMYTAGQVVADLCEETRTLLSGEVELLAPSIGRALMAERQACAKAAHDCLALEFQNDYGSLPDSVSEAILSRGDEDAAIRRGTP